MLIFTEAQLMQWVGLAGWAFIRIGALFISMPIFSAQAVSARVRVLLAVTITLAALPALPPQPVIAPFSSEGMMTTLQQVGIGILMGFIIQLVFASVIFAGQAIAFSMGLGFAAMVDPQTGVSIPVISQFYLILTTFLFLALDGHLILFGLIIESFKTLPIGPDALTSTTLWEFLRWSSQVFSGGLLMALPIMAILLLMNMALGVASRAAPQLNIFSVGFSVTILLGAWLIAITLGNLLQYFSTVMDQGLSLVQLLF